MADEIERTNHRHPLACEQLSTAIEPPSIEHVRRAKPNDASVFNCL